ncbi:MAG TPA: SLC13 family permease [Clostridia bacterium]
MIDVHLTTSSFIAIAVLLTVYFFLITEKVNKVLVSILGAMLLIVLQVFKTHDVTSQAGGFAFIANNLDVLFFVIGMMILVGIVKESGVFESAAIWLAKKVKGKPVLLLIAISYLTFFMTVFLSNIPTILIMLPVLIILIKELKLPPLPYLLAVITMGNIGGAVTPFSDPTTYYQSKTVGLTFVEVVSNSGLIAFVLSIVSVTYISLIFNKQLKAVKVNPKDVAAFDPKAAIKDRKILAFGLPILALAILFMVMKDTISSITGLTFDNATVVMIGAFLAMLVFNKNPKDIFLNIVDWEIIFFFMGLFIVVGSLQYTGVVQALAAGLVTLSHRNLPVLQFLITFGSGILSMFIDNVPYNITMVGAIQSMGKIGIFIYPLWWALNLGTSLGGAGSPIGAACNVVALGLAEKEKIHTRFMKYLAVGAPLVVINSLVTFAIIWLRYH